MLADEIMADFHVLADKESGLNDITISTILHSVHLA